MNKRVLWAYMKFYTGIVFIILLAATLYAAVGKMESPVILCIIDAIAALIVCIILSLISGRYTRIITQQIKIQDIESLKKYLCENKFVKSEEREYSWMRTPTLLLRNMKVTILKKDNEVIIFIPYFMREWRNKKY